EVFAGQVCYDHTEKEWYLWQGHHWTRDDVGKMRQLVAGLLATLYLKAAADLNTEHATLDLKIQAMQRVETKEQLSEPVEPLKERFKVLSGQMSVLRERARVLRSAKRTQNVLTFIQAEVGITSEVWDTHPWLLPVPNGVIDLQSGECR